MVSRGQPAGRAVLHVIDPQQAWMQPLGGYDGTFTRPEPLYTVDGGLSWTRIPAPTL